MIRYNKIKINLVDFKEKFTLKLNDNGNFVSRSKVFDNFSNIPDLYVEDNLITKKQSNFYNEIKFPNYDKEKNIEDLRKNAKNSAFAMALQKELKLGGKILEVGCGTGQMALFLSQYHRAIYGIDISKGSLELAEKFREQNSINNVFFLRMNIFKNFFEDETFDVIISNGVLHHTWNPELAFEILTKKLKKDGIIIIGLYHRYGRLITNALQSLGRLIGKNKFNFFLRKDGKNSTWALDQYFNPHEKSYDLKTILNWYEKNNIEVLNTLPFHWDPNSKLIEKKELKKLGLVEEFLYAFNRNQIKENGFFVVIGKKK